MDLRATTGCSVVTPRAIYVVTARTVLGRCDIIEQHGFALITVAGIPRDTTPGVQPSLFRLCADAVHRLTFHADDLGDGRKSDSLIQKFSHSEKLFTRECWLPSPIFCPVVVCQGMLDSGFLRLFRHFAWACAIAAITPSVNLELLAALDR